LQSIIGAPGADVKIMYRLNVNIMLMSEIDLLDLSRMIPNGYSFAPTGSNGHLPEP
jgi:hypothetical protein